MGFYCKRQKGMAKYEAYFGNCPPIRHARLCHLFPTPEERPGLYGEGCNIDAHPYQNRASRSHRQPCIRAESMTTWGPSQDIIRMAFLRIRSQALD
jgi:hypothetical protein